MHQFILQGFGLSKYDSRSLGDIRGYLVVPEEEMPVFTNNIGYRMMLHTKTSYNPGDISRTLFFLFVQKIILIQCDCPFECPF